MINIVEYLWAGIRLNRNTYFNIQHHTTYSKINRWMNSMIYHQLIVKFFKEIKYQSRKGSSTSYLLFHALLFYQSVRDITIFY